MAAWLRVLANPKVLKRFLGTKAGKKAVLKYGSMFLESKLAQKAIDKFMGGPGKQIQGDKDYKKMEKEYAKLQSKVEKLETQLENARDDQAKMQTLTFTLGRQVIGLQRLLIQMQSQYQNTINAQTMAYKMQRAH